TKAPPKLRASNTNRKTAFTPASAPGPRRRLLQTRVVRRDVRERLVGNRSQDGFQLRQRRIARAALVRLEQQELIADVAGRLAGDGRHELGRVPLTFGAVARRARGGGGAASLDGRPVQLAG